MFASSTRLDPVTGRLCFVAGFARSGWGRQVLSGRFVDIPGWPKRCWSYSVLPPLKICRILCVNSLKFTKPFLRVYLGPTSTGTRFYNKPGGPYVAGFISWLRCGRLLIWWAPPAQTPSDVDASWPAARSQTPSLINFHVACRVRPQCGDRGIPRKRGLPGWGRGSSKPALPTQACMDVTLHFFVRDMRSMHCMILKVPFSRSSS